MPDKPSVPKPQDPHRRPGDEPRRQPGSPEAGDAPPEDEDNPLESLGKAVAEPVLGADRTTTADRVRDKLDRPGGTGTGRS